MGPENQKVNACSRGNLVRRPQVWSGILAFCMGTVFPSVGASETIRVALSQKAAQVHVQSGKSARLRVSSGRRVPGKLPVTVKPTVRGLLINGHQKITKESFIIQSGKGTITLSINERAGESSSHGRKWVVSGSVTIKASGASLLVVNQIDLDDYVAGVVVSEINTGWHLEVLKAQAVAARTYVLRKKMLNQDQPYDVVASVQDQVYTGRTQVNGSVRKAVHETQNIVVTYDDRPIFAAYSSTAAGPTEDAKNVWSKDLPYLKGVDCPFDRESPRFQWRAAIELTTIERQLRKSGYPIGVLATLTPFTYTQAGRIDQIRILHSKGEIILRGQDFRRVIGYAAVPSTHFTIEKFGEELVLAGRGSGHAVGLCQWGAKEMAELGYRHQSILQYYYPGTQLTHRRKVLMTSPS